VRVRGKWVKVQIWDVYDSPQFKSMFHHYSKGAYGALILLTEKVEHDAHQYIEEVYKYCGRIPIMIIIVDEKDKDELALDYEDTLIDNPVKSLEILVQRIFDEQVEPVYFRLPYSVLPPYSQLSNTRRLDHLATMPLNVPLVKEILEAMGFKVENDELYLKDEKAIYTVDLRNGEVYVEPVQCENCERDCIKKEKLCMVLATSGWSSSPDLSQADLLLISKVYAIANNEVPIDVREKIDEILYCPTKNSKKQRNK
ncbi:MAG: hypothetical protein QXV37_02210, partial [Candidatus Jordarchaeaceae archaeon]